MSLFLLCVDGQYYCYERVAEEPMSPSMMTSSCGCRDRSKLQRITPMLGLIS
jgi:hypothetical protein